MFEVIALVLALVAVILLRRAESRISKLENRVKDLEARPLAAAAPVAADVPEEAETLAMAAEPHTVDAVATETPEPPVAIEMAVHPSKDMLGEASAREPAGQASTSAKPSEAKRDTVA